MSTREVRFELELGPLGPDSLTVLSFEATEELNRPYSLSVTVQAPVEEPLDAAGLIATQGALTVTSWLSEPRRFAGIVRSIIHLGTDEERRSRYRVVLVPRLARLGYIRRSRVFQGLSVPEMVEKVLGEAEVPLAAELQASYAPVEYCVQYRESDLDFVSRLLEEAGIRCFFRQDGEEGETVVLRDAPVDHPPLEGESATLEYGADAGVVTGVEWVRSLTVGHRLATGKVTLRDFDYLQPASDLTVQSVRDGGNEALERYEHSARVRFAGESLEKRHARMGAERAGQAARSVHGESTSPRFQPGAAFVLLGHPVGAFDRKYVLTRVSHHATKDGYANSFEALDADLPYRPPRRGRAPVIPGVQTATVVGPAGEEIHTDAHGRVKVQFHWDREGKRDENASCWVRVSQGWAGLGQGAVFLPRIGHEVVVRFLDGDPDRPLIVGSTYNGTNPPPVELPANKTQSTLRTESTPGGGGFNELRFEDAAGAEEIFVHAQRNEDIDVLADKVQSIGRHESLTVAKNRKKKIDGDQSMAIASNDGTLVGGHQRVTVARDRRTDVSVAQVESVSGNQSVQVTGLHALNVGALSAEQIGQSKRVTVGGAFALTVAQDSEQKVEGRRALLVGAASVAIALKDREEEVEKDYSRMLGARDTIESGKSIAQEVEKDLAVKSEGAMLLAATKEVGFHGKELTLQAGDSLTLVVGGKKLVELAKSGKVKIAAKSVVIEGSSKIVLKGSKIDKVSPGSAAPAKKVEVEKPSKPEEKKLPKVKSLGWGKKEVSPGADGSPAKATLEASVENVPDGAKAEISIHHAVTGRLVPGGILKGLQVRGGKVLDRAGKAPEFEFGSAEKPWEEWKQPFFHYKLQLPEHALSAESPKESSDALRVAYMHSIFSDGESDWLTENSEGGSSFFVASGKLAKDHLTGQPHHQARHEVLFGEPNTSEWSKLLRHSYSFLYCAHGGVGEEGESILWGLTPADVRDPSRILYVPRYLAFLNTCYGMKDAQMRLPAALLARGTEVVLGYQVEVLCWQIANVAHHFFMSWADVQCSPDISDTLFHMAASKYPELKALSMRRGRVLEQVNAVWKYDSRPDLEEKLANLLGDAADD